MELALLTVGRISTHRSKDAVYKSILKHIMADGRSISNLGRIRFFSLFGEQSCQSVSIVFKIWHLQRCVRSSRPMSFWILRSSTKLVAGFCTPSLKPLKKNTFSIFSCSGICFCPRNMKGSFIAKGTAFRGRAVVCYRKRLNKHITESTRKQLADPMWSCSFCHAK